jgi:carboxyl-terminal processing protease
MSPRSRLFIAFVSTAIMAYIAVGSLLGRVFGDTSYGQLAVFNEVIRLVLDAYVEPINLDRTMAGADLGLTEALDGDSAYMDADEFRAYQNPPKDGDAEVGLVLTRRFSFLMVVAPRPGSPAEKAGLKAGDIIKTIDGRHSRTLGVPVGERLLRGAPGSVVKLKVLRAGSDPLDFNVVRERLVTVAPKSKVLEDGTGYLRVAELSGKAADEARGQLETLKRSGAKRLVLDLRGTAAGASTEAVKVAEMFLKGGVVTKIVSRHAAEQVLSADPARTAWDQPLAVLVDSATAGSAEIVVAALLDAGRAPIVGEHTFGRAPIQKAFPMAEGGILLTVAKYVSPKGNPIHGKGIEPTVPVETEAQAGGAEAAQKDQALEKAIEVLKAEGQKAA